MYLQLQWTILKKINHKKLINLLLLHGSYLISRNKVLFNNRLKPAFLSIEPADFCQLGCPECPVGVLGKKTGKTIDPEFYKQIIDQLQDKLIYLNLFFQGEPLFNKSLAELISFAHSKRIFTTTSTNAQLLNNHRAKEIVASGLDKIIISIDGTTQEIYEKYRKNGSLQKVIDGVKHLNYWKNELKQATPFIELQFIVFRFNEHQIDEFKTLAKTLKVDIAQLKSAQINDLNTGTNELTSIPKHARYTIDDKGRLHIKSKLRNKCWRMWSSAVITSTGELLPCCFDKKADHSYGNLRNASFTETWQNRLAHSFRLSIIQNRKQHSMCRNCTTK